MNDNQWVGNVPSKNFNMTKGNSGAVSADSVEQSRASSAKLKGRLGHLVAAISEAHSSSASTNMDRFSNGAHSIESDGPSHMHSNAWVSADSSLDSIEVHMCSKCDRMYSNREALEHHQSICTF